MAYQSRLVMVILERLLAQNVLEGTQDLSVNRVLLVLSSMILGSVCANHAKTNQLIHSTIKSRKRVFLAPINVFLDSSVLRLILYASHLWTFKLKELVVL